MTKLKPIPSKSPATSSHKRRHHDTLNNLAKYLATQSKKK
ncbi:UNVERIFIED_CONTAM: hypothetical protein ABID98_001896 [Brevibacillus sp. OAP136]